MKKIRFVEHVLPHALAILTFFLVTLFFFNPIFFDGKVLQQHDIQQFQGSSKEIIDYRQQTGEEALWTNRMFGGMPAYLISVQWSTQAIAFLKQALTLALPHPISNIFAAFISYYILLLAFGVRPFLAIGGALAFGLSSYMLIGLGAGHNGRIGAIAFMPLVMAGIHLVFSNKRILGLGVTTAGLALHFRENHVQITYYLLIIVLGYGIMQLVIAIREKKIPALITNVVLLIPAALLAVGTFFGTLWAVQEYSPYTIRGKSELVSKTTPFSNSQGLDKAYAFQYSNDIWEPMTLLIPNFYGGATASYLVQDPESKTYQALMRSGDEQTANQLAPYTRSYWGPQMNTAPYYAGALVCLLFAIGIAFAEKKYIAWLVPVSVLGVMMSWGSSFESFNYFLFDYLPAYNKFRSVTFALLLTLFAMPLLGLLGLEKLLTQSWTDVKKKLIWPVSLVGGLCLLLAITGGLGSFLAEGESQLPVWLTKALQEDRTSLLRSDAWRSFWFILIFSVVVWASLQRYVKEYVVAIAFSLLMVIDLAGVDSRYFTKENYVRKRGNTFFTATEADTEILKDKTHYRVYNLQGTFSEARTSYFHQSIGGYHGAKMRRYQDLYDSVLFKETNRFISDLQAGTPRFDSYHVMNMLNVKYVTYGNERNNVIPLPSTNGAAWFVKDVLKVNSPTEELNALQTTNTKTTAVIDASAFEVGVLQADSTASIKLVNYKPNQLTYESSSTAEGLAVFSEIYYPKGWVATIDGKEASILRANYVLRALTIPAGKHTIVFEFKPAPYYIGNKVSMASSWLVLILVLGTVGWSLRKND